MTRLRPRVLIRALGSIVTKSGQNARLSILIYHRVLPEPDIMLHDEIDATVFRAHMDALYDGFNVLPLCDAVERLADGTLPPRSACITFDDGYANNETVALPILKERALPACFFISTEFTGGGCMWNDIVIEALRATSKSQLDLRDIDLGLHPIDDIADRLSTMTKLLALLKFLTLDARGAAVDRIVTECEVQRPKDMMMTSAQIRSLTEAGMEVGGHTISHPILSTLNDSQARAEIGGGKRKLEEVTGHAVRAFAYPNGRPGKDFTEAHVTMLKELGFLTAVTTSNGVSTGKTDPYLLPRFTPWDRTPARFALRLYQNALS